MTITEALAEIKTIAKRIQSKREFVRTYMVRLENLKDPFEKDGGSNKKLAEEMQAIKDLEQRVVDLRREINFVNDTTQIEIEGVKRTIAAWIIWRREVAPTRERFINDIRLKLENARGQLRAQPVYLTKGEAEKPQDMVVNVDEAALAKEAEQLKNILGQLDGQLSLKNATTMINI
jgi:hypothetical protein